MKLYRFLLALALATTAGGACAFQLPARLNALDDSAGTAVSVSQARGDALRALKLIEGALGRNPQLACNRCKSGFALKVVEEALRKQPALTDEQYAVVERLRAEGQSLYNEEKYVESLELLRQAQSILGIDSSGSPQPPPADSPPAAGAKLEPRR
jgi:tetratricopeptide (TPR) repeat protein